MERPESFCSTKALKVAKKRYYHFRSFGPSCFVKASETWTFRAALIYAQFFMSNSRGKWGNLEDDMIDLKREQSQLKLKLNHLHDNVNIILKIMASRQPIVKRI